MISFYKDATCPTSQDLLDFQNDELAASHRRRVREHICSCDFCGAEAEFYAHCPQDGEEKIIVAEIPTPLYELAETLLTNKHQDLSLLNKLLCGESEGLTLREA